jgi:hypothetical protein
MEVLAPAPVLVDPILAVAPVEELVATEEAGHSRSTTRI